MRERREKEERKKREKETHDREERQGAMGIRSGGSKRAPVYDGRYSGGSGARLYEEERRKAKEDGE
jgi:hypothetical protein